MKEGRALSVGSPGGGGAVRSSGSFASYQPLLLLLLLSARAAASDQLPQLPLSPRGLCTSALTQRWAGIVDGIHVISLPLKAPV